MPRPRWEKYQIKLLTFTAVLIGVVVLMGISFYTARKGGLTAIDTTYADVNAEISGFSCGPDGDCDATSDNKSDEVNIGEKIRYEINVLNLGNQDAQNATGVHSIPDGTCYVVGSTEDNLPLGITVTYSNDDQSTWTYSPVADLEGTDCNVTDVLLTFTSDIAAHFWEQDTTAEFETNTNTLVDTGNNSLKSQRRLIDTGMEQLPGCYVYALDINPLDPTNLVLGCNNHIFITYDTGATWTEITHDFPVEEKNIMEAHILPTSPIRIFIANINAVYYTDNLGVTWTKSSTSAFSYVWDIVHKPDDPSIMLIATYGTIQRSTNYGVSFSTVSNSSYREVKFHPNSPNYAIAASETTSNRVMFSDNAGATWYAATNTGLPVTQSLGIAFDAVDPDTAYASMYGVTAIYKTTDHGENWTLSLPGVRFWRMQQESTAAGVVYGTPGGGGGIYNTVNGGSTWNNYPLTTMSPVYSHLLFKADPTVSGVVYTTNYYTRGTTPILRSTDYADTFSGIVTDLKGYGAETAAVSQQDSDVVYITSDNGIDNFLKSTDGGDTFTTLPNAPFKGEIIIDPMDDETVYLRAYDQGVYKSTDGGDSWNEKNAGFPDLQIDRITISRSNPDVLYASNRGDGIYRSDDGGDSWSITAVSFPFNVSNVRNYMGIDPTDEDIVFVPVNSDGVYRSTDGGANWTSVLTPVSDIRGIYVAPSNTSFVYAVQSANSGLYRSENSGNPGTFSAVSESPYMYDSLGLAIDPTDETHLIGAWGSQIITTTLIWESFDKGVNWTVIDPPLGHWGIRDPASSFDGTNWHVYIPTLTNGLSKFGYPTTSTSETASPIDPIALSGSLYKWGNLLTNSSTPSGDAIYYTIKDASNSDISGFVNRITTGVGLIDLSSLSTTTYSTINLQTTLTSGDNWTTPTVLDWSVTYATNPSTVTIETVVQDSATTLSDISGTVLATTSTGEASTSNNSDTYVLTINQAPETSVVISGDATYTNTRLVSIDFTTTDESPSTLQMRLSENASFSGSSWQTYLDPAPFTLGSTNTSHTVYAQLKDDAGNLSNVTSDLITLDTVSAVGGIAINDGQIQTADPNVTLQLTALDSLSGVEDMKISTKSSFAGAVWESFVSEKSYALSDPDGVKTFYVKFRDNALNVSPTYSASIIFDRNGPTGTFMINNGNEYTPSVNVTLTFDVYDISGVDKIKASLNPDLSGASWNDYTASNTFSLLNEKGKQTVYVRLLDKAGNESTTMNDDITLDQDAPTGSVVINGGDSYTNTRVVTLTLQSMDVQDVTQMQLSEDESFNGADWISFATVQSYTLTNKDGKKTVYTRFKDGSGNVSKSYNDTIILDTKGPDMELTAITTIAYSDSFSTYYYVGSNPRFIGTGETNLTVDLYVDGANKKSVNSSSKTRWEILQTLSPGTYEIKLIGYDLAGNAKTYTLSLVVGLSEEAVLPPTITPTPEPTISPAPTREPSSPTTPTPQSSSNTSTPPSPKPTDPVAPKSTDSFLEKTSANLRQLTKDILSAVIQLGSKSVIVARSLANESSNSTAAVTVAAATFVAPITAGLIPPVAAAIQFTSIWHLPGLLLGLIIKKRKPWGVVYDVVTKQPLDPALVTLVDENGETAQTLTDIFGRYQFLVKPGTYTIKVDKANYNFPPSSEKFHNLNNDPVYSDVYTGQRIYIGKDSTILHNIPLEPVKADWNQAEKDRIGIRHDSPILRVIPAIARILFAASMLWAVVAFLLVSSIPNTIVLCFFIVVLGVKIIVKSRHAWGVVKNNKTAISDAVVRLVNPNVPMMQYPPVVTDKTGRYSFLVQEGTYKINVEVKDPAGGYRKIYEGEPIKISKKYDTIKRRIKVPRLSIMAS
ncbi:hypothetical protein KC614_00545 [candidate division WWE3 bacterium]|uniref:DUF11 domain-containing protein n=1 Tax=candidate division WWE3 bacterium TaxID=2053526 RepID=A0A955RRL6_UNCKA|nr:hypothetical protein [candidate division WWE3 bacterium]